MADDADQVVIDMPRCSSYASRAACRSLLVTVDFTLLTAVEKTKLIDHLGTCGTMGWMPWAQDHKTDRAGSTAPTSSAKQSARRLLSASSRRLRSVWVDTHSRSLSNAEPWWARIGRERFLRAQCRDLDHTYRTEFLPTDVYCATHRSLLLPEKSTDADERPSTALELLQPSIEHKGVRNQGVVRKALAKFVAWSQRGNADMIIVYISRIVLLSFLALTVTTRAEWLMVAPTLLFAGLTAYLLINRFVSTAMVFLLCWAVLSIVVLPLSIPDWSAGNRALFLGIGTTVMAGLGSITYLVLMLVRDARPGAARDVGSDKIVADESIGRYVPLTYVVSGALMVAAVCTRLFGGYSARPLLGLAVVVFLAGQGVLVLRSAENVRHGRRDAPPGPPQVGRDDSGPIPFVDVAGQRSFFRHISESNRVGFRRLRANSKTAGKSIFAPSFLAAGSATLATTSGRAFGRYSVGGDPSRLGVAIPALVGGVVLAAVAASALTGMSWSFDLSPVPEGGPRHNLGTTLRSLRNFVSASWFGTVLLFALVGLSSWIVQRFVRSSDPGAPWITLLCLVTLAAAFGLGEFNAKKADQGGRP